MVLSKPSSAPAGCDRENIRGKRFLREEDAKATEFVEPVESEFGNSTSN